MISGSDGRKVSKRQKAWGCTASNTAVAFTVKKKDISREKVTNRIENLRKKGSTPKELVD